MGTTLQNGVYLPNEGERNCYAGLKTNWEILDQKVADVTALQQAVAGALHREIVASLPTTDIDPNTIYMILSGTSATENVYNEFMYVNNAWELIGTSATDLTNYYTKGDVDGLLLLKANASDLTSHTGDTTIHVTANDKTKWTNSANIVVLRLAKTALTPSSSTNAFSNLDDSTALKVGDKVMDTAGVLFEVTAIDTQNSTFTIGTALIDLAQDSDVVHKSGDETITGVKTFSDNPLIGNNNTNITISNRQVTANSSYSAPTGNSYSYIQLKAMVNYTDSSPSIDATVGLSVQENAYSDGKNKAFNPSSNNIIDLGLSGKRWANVYATNYYYGSGEVEFSTKFITTDTNQTISGAKTFSSTPVIYNSDANGSVQNLYLRNQLVTKGDTSTSGSQLIRFSDSADKMLCRIQTSKISNGNTTLNLRADTVDTNNNDVSTEIQVISARDGSKSLSPQNDNAIDLGRKLTKWKNLYINLINGLTPSSLSLPCDRSARVDISGYFTNIASGDSNTYTAPANGWIYLSLNDVTAVNLVSRESGGLTNYADYRSRSSNGALLCLFPIRSGDVFVSQWYTTTTVTVTNAYFIPCQGNV